MAKSLVVDKSICTECRACELRCSFAHFGVFNPNKAGIRIVARWPELPHVRLCRQCDDPSCLDACPVGALERGEDGVVHVKWEDCTGCGACVEACPYDGIWLDPLSGVAIKCDTCGGEYQCVAGCMAGALSIGE